VLADIARHRAAIEATGTQVAFVHMSAEDDAIQWFQHYGIPDLMRISDSDQLLYRQFGLDQARVVDLIHPRVWWRWFRTAILKGYGVGSAGRHWRQRSGVFVIYRGHTLAAMRHRDSATRPDYVALVHALKLGTTIRSA